MTGIRKNLLSVMLATSTVALAACGSSNPTSPTSTTPPVIQSLTPGSPTASASTQVLTVTGTNFAAGLSLILKGPDTGATLYPATTISEQTATSFKATVTMAVAGNWTATVRLSDNTDSAQFPFTVTTVTASNPQISSAGPSPVVNSTSMQTIAVSGVNFRAGLSLVVRAPNGVATTYNGASITGQTSTAFSAQVLLSSFGLYELTVRNADGLESGVYSLVVNPIPLVTEVVPFGLTKSDTPQVIQVTGLHFASGLSYVIKGPDTGAVLHGSADVSSLTATSFRGVATLNVAGDWSITVINANGVSSAQFAFRVGS